jgi:membrane protein DedA with SNARE-associated domain
MNAITRTLRLHPLLAVLVAASALATLWFGVRTYRSFVVLRTAYQVGMPELGNMRAWMTLDYVASAYRAPLPRLVARLGLPAETSPGTTLKDVADARGVSRFQFVREVQQALADVGARGPPPATANESGWSGGIADRVLSAVLAYGYPVLAATFALGAVGLPLPTGLAAVLAGSLAALGKIAIVPVAVIIVLASVAGDLAGYGIGRFADENFLARRGRWIGYSAQAKEHIRSLFDRWGGLTVVLTRTLVSHLSTVVSLFAGIGRYRLAAFLVLTLIGRALWTSAYLGLGYGIGSNVEVASNFLANLTGLLVCSAVLLASAAYGAGLPASPAKPD